MKSKIYILIPIYNVEQYIDECLMSILKQSYKNYDVILVDDGSTDSSGAICDKYAEEYENIEIIHKPNGGLLSARRTAIRFIKENREWQDTYCIFVDSDDALKENAMEVIAENIEASSCDMLIYGYEIFGEEGVSYTSHAEREGRCIITDRAELLRKAIIQHTYNSMCRKAVRTEFLFGGNFEGVMNIQMGEDLIQSTLMYQKCNIVQIIPDILYRYRINKGSITHGVKIKKYTDDLSSREFAVRVICDEGLWNDEDYSAYRNKCLVVLLSHIKQILTSSKDEEMCIAYLETLYDHSFFVDFCRKGITKKSKLLLKLFNSHRFKTIWILWQVNKLKNKGLRR